MWDRTPPATPSLISHSPIRYVCQGAYWLTVEHAPRWGQSPSAGNRASRGHGFKVSRTNNDTMNRTCETGVIMGNRKWTDEELTIAVANSTTMSDVIRKLGLGMFSGNHQTVYGHVDRLCLDISHFTGKTKRTPGSLVRYTLDEILVENSTYASSVKKRVVSAGLLQDVCAICGCPPVWNGQPLVLQLDHINGNHTDNRIENLRLVCPNCHSQTDTFSGGNRREKYSKPIPEPKQVGHHYKFKFDHDEMVLLVNTMPLTKIAERFGVTDNAIKHRCQKMGIETSKGRGFWTRYRDAT